MGCASSGPLGKNLVDGAKDTAGDVAHMGESTLHDLGEAAKGGMEHVKEAVESAVHHAEHGLGSMMGKIEDTIGHKKEDADKLTSDMKEAVDGFEANTEETMGKISDGLVEEVSEAETVLASDIEDTKAALMAKTSSITEKFAPPSADDVKVEDMEEMADDGMGSTIVMDESKKKVEELVAKMPTPAPTPPPEGKAEPLTLWEQKADAILNRPKYPSMRVSDLEPGDDPIIEGKGEDEPAAGSVLEPVVEAEIESEEISEVDIGQKVEENEEENEEEKEEEKEDEETESESIDLDLVEREKNMMRMYYLESDLKIEEMIG